MYELMERMYKDFSEFKTEMNQFREETKANMATKDDIKDMATKDDIRRIEQNLARVEHNHGEKLSALFDDREVQKEINETIINTLDRIEAKIEVLQIETAHIRRVK